MRFPTATIVTAISLVVQVSSVAKPFDDTKVGMLTLPNIDPDHVPQECKSFTAACAAERDQNYELAFQLYEARYNQCGDYGWTFQGKSSGSSYTVAFKTTPCGLPVAIKTLPDPRECFQLKRVASGGALQECPGCFPRWYWYGNDTKACYSEFVARNGSWEDALPARSKELTGAQVATVKSLYLQGVHAIRVLREHNIEHHDMAFRNIALQKTADGGPKLVIFDFSGAQELDEYTVYRMKKLNAQVAAGTSAALDHTGPVSGAVANRPKVKSLRTSPDIKLRPTHQMAKPRVLGVNGRFTDLFTFTCDFLVFLYNHCGYCSTCWSNVYPVKDDERDTTSFKFAFGKVMDMNANFSSVPDYKEIRRLIGEVTHK